MSKKKIIKKLKDRKSKPTMKEKKKRKIIIKYWYPKIKECEKRKKWKTLRNLYC